MILATQLNVGFGRIATLLADGAGGGQGPGMFAGGNMLLLVVMFGIFYFLLIRPQQKRQREHQDWQRTLKVNDEVVTSGGLWGKIKGVSDNSPYLTLELQEKVRVRVLRSHVNKPPGSNEAAAEQAKQ